MRSVRLPLIAAATAALLALPARAQQREIPIEQLMSAPYPGGLSAAPSGGLVAWVLNDRGVRNLWVAGPPEYRGRKLTSYAQADGQEVG